MPESFGARLRERRERQHIVLTTIAEQTKIKASLLEALERDDVSQWPSGIFRRAFVRAYAHAIGLDPDLVVREFLELYPEPAEADANVPTAATAPDGVTARSAPPIRLRYLMSSAVASLSRRWTRRPPLEVDRSPAASTEPVAQSDWTPVKATLPSDVDLVAVADLCTQLGRIDETGGATPLLREAARILDAVGLIVWVWHPQATELRPALAQGYSDKVLAQLPGVARDADNATAAAFRSACTCAVNGSDRGRGALVAPLMTPIGCVGVLAIELQHGRERLDSVRALVTIFAAQLARVVAVACPAVEADRRLA
jgi:transcriptional regulator with XRE-family HTH domain